MPKVKSAEFVDTTDSSSDNDSDAELKKKKKKENLKKAEKRKSEDLSIDKASKKLKTEKSPSKKEKATKKEGGGSSSSSNVEGNAKDGFELGRLRKVSVSEFRGRTLVNIREYYTDDGGDLKPGRKGIALTAEQWNSLLDVKDEVNNASNGDSWELGKKKFVRLNEFRGKMLYDIREMYEADGELKPGKKGISLSREQWDKVLSCADDISNAL